MMPDLPRRRVRYRRYAREVRKQMISSEGISPRSRHSKDQLELPSADVLLRFTADFRIWAWWDSTEPTPPNLLDIAKHGVAQRARQISARHRLTGMAALRSELNARLLVWENVEDTPVQARADCERIAADPDLVDAVAEHDEAQRRQAVSSWKNEERKRRHEEVCAELLDPLRATASWFLENADKPTEAVEVARRFQELRELLLPVGPSELDTAGKLVDELLDSAEPSVCRYLIHVLDQFFMSHKRQDLAERLTSLAAH